MHRKSVSPAFLAQIFRTDYFVVVLAWLEGIFVKAGLQVRNCRQLLPLPIPSPPQPGVETCVGQSL